MPIVRSLSRSSSRYSIDDPLRSPTSRAGEGPPDQYIRPPRGVSASACTSSRTASSRPGPNQRSSSGVSGISFAAHATCAAHDERVLRVHDRAFGRSPRQLGGVRGVPLVELVVARDEHGDRSPARTPRSPRLLPHRGEGAGEAVQDHRVEPADVDAELERVRGRDAEQPSARQLELERAAFLGEVAGPVRGDPIRELGRGGREPAARVLRDDLGTAATAGEREGLVHRAHEVRHELGGLDVGRRARAGVRVEERSLPAREHAFGTRRGVVDDRLDVESAQRARELARIADRGAREEERGRGAVVLAQPAEAAQYVRDVRPEDAAQCVQLVDDDVLQSHEERRPTLVRRQDAHVQHLGVGEHHVRVLARPGPVVARGVAVVRDGAESGHEPRAQRSQLVLRERLGGKEQQRGVAPVFDDRRHDRRLVAQRLPRRGAGRHDRHCAGRATRRSRRPGARTDCVDAARVDALRDLGVQRVGELRGSGRAVRAALRDGRSGRSAPGRRRDRRARSTHPCSARSPVTSTRGYRPPAPLGADERLVVSAGSRRWRRRGSRRRGAARRRRARGIGRRCTGS